MSHMSTWTSSAVTAAPILWSPVRRVPSIGALDHGLPELDMWSANIADLSQDNISSLEIRKETDEINPAIDTEFVDFKHSQTK